MREMGIRKLLVDIDMKKDIKKSLGNLLIICVYV